jgi:hypothetical protein
MYSTCDLTDCTTRESATEEKRKRVYFRVAVIRHCVLKIRFSLVGLATRRSLQTAITENATEQIDLIKEHKQKMGLVLVHLIWFGLVVSDGSKTYLWLRL